MQCRLKQRSTDPKSLVLALPVCSRSRPGILNPVEDGLSLDDLPQVVLLNIYARLPKAELISSLPLVSRLFSQLMRLLNSCWTEVFYVRNLEGASKLVDGAAVCEWLRPRLAGLDEFCCAVDTLNLRDDESLPAMLIPILPTALKQLRLQREGLDGLGIANSRTSLHAGAGRSSPPCCSDTPVKSTVPECATALKSRQCW